MNDQAHMRRIAETSAQRRVTTRIIRDLTAARPLTAEQRNSIIAAAIAIPTVDDLRKSA